MELSPIFQRVVGLDIHQAQITACAVITEADGTTTTEHQQFSTFKLSMANRTDPPVDNKIDPPVMVS